jgi:hypothetical protein
MEQPSEHEVIDWLLATLLQKGASRFNIYFDLEEQYGSSFAKEKADFFESKLKLYKLAERDPEDQILRLTYKGKQIVKNGGWLLFVEEHRQRILLAARLKAQAKKGIVAGSEAAISEPKPKAGGLMLPGRVALFVLAFIVIFVMIFNDIHN